MIELYTKDEVKLLLESIWVLLGEMEFGCAFQEGNEVLENVVTNKEIGIVDAEAIRKYVYRAARFNMREQQIELNQGIIESLHKRLEEQNGI